MKLSKWIEILSRELADNGDSDVLVEQTTKYKTPKIAYASLRVQRGQYYKSISKDSKQYLVIK